MGGTGRAASAGIEDKTRRTDIDEAERYGEKEIPVQTAAVGEIPAD